MTNREHKAYDGREVRCDQLGIKGKAWLSHAWDDWYYIHVDGIANNGNHINGVYCREQADTVARYLKD